MREGKLQAWFTRMSDRERKLVVGGGLVVGLVTLGLVAVFVQGRVAALEESVAEGSEALAEVRGLAPAYLSNRREEKAIDEALERARGDSLQSLLLAVAKEIQFERKYAEDGAGGPSRLSDFIKFSNANEVLADLTSRAGRGKPASARKSKKNKPGKDERAVFLASIEVVFERVPDTALFQFLEQVDGHQGGLFATSLDVNRDSPNREHFRAKMTIAQFRYGGEGGGS